MSDAVTIRVTIPRPLDLSGKVAKQIPFATSKALNAVAFKGRTKGVDALPRTFTVRNKFVAQGVNVLKATKRDLSAAVGIEQSREFMSDHIEGGHRHESADKSGSSIPLGARKTKADKLTPSKFAGAMIAKDSKRAGRRVFFLELGGRLFLMRRLRIRDARSRGSLKRDYKGRAAGTPLLPREKIEALYTFRKGITIKAAWNLPLMVERVVAEDWDREMAKALDAALGSAT
jgi:hypothetical protein